MVNHQGTKDRLPFSSINEVCKKSKRITTSEKVLYLQHNLSGTLQNVQHLKGCFENNKTENPQPPCPKKMIKKTIKQPNEKQKLSLETEA